MKADLQIVEGQVINKILHTKSIAFLRNNDIDESYFPAYLAEYEFIMGHYKEFGNVPDMQTFMANFESFESFEVTESDKYLISKLKEEKTFQYVATFLREVATLASTKPDEAVKRMLSEVPNLSKMRASYRVGYDIVKNVDERKKDFDFRQNAKGLLGLSTGLKELDELLHGWLNEDFVAIAGRTNEGKSWVLLFFLVMAWLKGSSVLLYSGEMSETIIGYRFDTYVAHFSNEALMSGKPDLKADLDYGEYLVNLSSNGTPFIVVTPKMLGSKKMTISQLEALIDEHNPDIIGVDQLSLMEDERATRGTQKREKYTNISEDLYSLSEKKQKPILSPVQASREAVKDKSNADSTPEAHHVAESDGIVQNTTRLLTIRYIDGVLKIAVKKNRYGKNNVEFMYIWDIDTGYIKPFVTSYGSDDEEEEPMVETHYENGEDLF